jgi:hypothetical protein
MFLTRRGRAVVIGLAAYLLGAGSLGGIAAERIRFDRRRAVYLHRYDEVVKRWHAYLIALERKSAAEAPSAVR